MLPNLYKLEIESASGIYQIEFLKGAVVPDSDSVFLVDRKIVEKVSANSSRYVAVEAIEEEKTLRKCEEILVNLASIEFRRGDALNVVGGGLIQDLGTLVSSIYMRGVKWNYFPTTLASMGDSCIGGKSSINAGEIKNLVGNFYPPQKVTIDVRFISTLPQIEMVAGLSEIIKICFARGFQEFENAISLLETPGLQNNEEALEELIYLSLKSKKYFVENDEFDQGIRKLLNFGHTFGHALESATNFLIPHGAAVLIGMLAALNHPLSVESDASRKLRNVCNSLLSTVPDFIKSNLKADFKIFEKTIANDKKNTFDSLILILPSANGLDVVADTFTSGAVERATAAMKRAIQEIHDEIL